MSNRVVGPYLPLVLSIIGALIIESGAAGQEGVSAELSLVPAGAMQRAGYYLPQRLTLSRERPKSIRKEPACKHRPLYGVISFGQGEHGVPIVLDEAPDASEARLYVDTNGDGEVTEDEKVDWLRRASKLKDRAGNDVNQILFQGSVRIATRSGDPEERRLGLGLYRFAPETARSRGLPEDLLLYYRDYARAGTLKLGGKEYTVMLLDERAAGHFGTVMHPENEPPRVSLLVDRNGDGRFDMRYEQYDLARPFNIAGNVYEVDVVSPDGATLKLKRSSVRVAEVPIPPDLSVGKPAIPFTRQTLDGKTVNFPGDFKGKIVLLDFWATWCGPCLAEIPGLVKNYEKYRRKGFEILGVSLDQPGQAEKIRNFLKERRMPWAQIYDGKFWQAEIAQLYGVESIPQAYLVDGTTGKILAVTPELRGEALETTLVKALEGLQKAGETR
ncbi:MAG: TlpA disulfide reductase family protein [Chloroherpetonaceae bacterium]|nr:TlpA family protein disulfide reductase [Chthonomonadaceae bacterium]MDW8207508.1 TlpA disulfide reductase family protein [Chloroherpetonaceae bacterium]